VAELLLKHTSDTALPESAALIKGAVEHLSALAVPSLKTHLSGVFKETRDLEKMHLASKHQPDRLSDPN
jgi:hypothetical protein